MSSFIKEPTTQQFKVSSLTTCLDFFGEPHLLVKTSSLIFPELMVKSQYTQPALSCQFFL
jgi:hypothetical protein